MANFYIAALVPTMQTNGAAFLSRCFQQRLAHRMTSLDATASLLLSQLNPTTFPSVVADVVEAGVCTAEEMTLSSLIGRGTGSSGASASKAALLRKAVVARSFITLLQVRQFYNIQRYHLAIDADSCKIG